ncbi:hypothetical protein [Pseudomonas sp. UBA1879]|uniref:hypothetical protein n=1 Tax=Pseudomonas sp. UBA1879 TaxID=1947305 RepID=UPI0025CDAB1F|nr:hypothetical protein [Pseudomonas sp. UBA1879]
MPFDSAIKHFIDASHMLHAKHPLGQAFAMGGALRACAMGIATVRRGELEADAQASFRMVEYMIESSGLSHADPLDIWISKAGAFEPDQMQKLSDLVNEVLAWFKAHNHD